MRPSKPRTVNAGIANPTLATDGAFTEGTVARCDEQPASIERTAAKTTVARNMPRFFDSAGIPTHRYTRGALRRINAGALAEKSLSLRVDEASTYEYNTTRLLVPVAPLTVIPLLQ